MSTNENNSLWIPTIYIVLIIVVILIAIFLYLDVSPEGPPEGYLRHERYLELESAGAKYISYGEYPKLEKVSIEINQNENGSHVITLHDQVYKNLAVRVDKKRIWRYEHDEYLKDQWKLRITDYYTSNCHVIWGSQTGFL
jgi:hypothetical protein